MTERREPAVSNRGVLPAPRETRLSGSQSETDASRLCLAELTISTWLGLDMITQEEEVKHDEARGALKLRYATRRMQTESLRRR